MLMKSMHFSLVANVAETGNSEVLMVGAAREHDAKVRNRARRHSTRSPESLT